MKYFLTLSLLCILCLTSCSSKNNEVAVKINNPKENVTSSQDWSYTGKMGPNHWGKLKEEYAICSKGKEQSPININTTVQKSLPLGINYHIGKFKVEIEKSTIKLISLSSSNTINISGKNYVLKQFHFHTPSEHLIKGNHTDMEIHFVHEDVNHSLAVFGILVDQGNHNKVFQKVVNSYNESKDKDKVITLNIQSLIPNSSKKVFYQGSLTTPPCTEGTKWIVFEKPIQFSDEQISFYQNLNYPSSRPIQPINDRKLFESW